MIHFHELLIYETLHFHYSTFSILLIERPNIKCVRGVNLSARRNERRGISLLVYLVPIHSGVEWMVLQLARTATATSHTFINISL